MSYGGGESALTFTNLVILGVVFMVALLAWSALEPMIQVNTVFQVTDENPEDVSASSTGAPTMSVLSQSANTTLDDSENYYAVQSITTGYSLLNGLTVSNLNATVMRVGDVPGTLLAGVFETVDVVDDGITLDDHGVKQLYPTTSGGREFVADFTGDMRVLENQDNDTPTNPELWARGNGNITIWGNGTATLQGTEPRMYVYESIDGSTEFWHNMELTIYYQRVSDNDDNVGGIVVGGPTNHQTQALNWPDPDSCNALGYYGMIRHTGLAKIGKEITHSGIDGEDKPNADNANEVFENGIPTDEWIGFKFVIREITEAGIPAVNLQVWYDTTDGDAGGTWVKIAEYNDIGEWSTDESTPTIQSVCGFDDNVVITEDLRNAAAILIRNTDDTNLVANYKKFSVREIDPDTSVKTIFWQAEHDDVENTIITHMSTPAVSGLGIYGTGSPARPASIQYVATADSVLVGEVIDTIAPTLRKGGLPNGTYYVGIINEDLTIKELFGTGLAEALTTSYVKTPFRLPTGQTYTIEEGDRIGVLFNSTESDSANNLQPNRDTGATFDSTDSYHSVYTTSWSSTSVDLTLDLQLNTPANLELTSVGSKQLEANEFVGLRGTGFESEFYTIYRTTSDTFDGVNSIADDVDTSDYAFVLTTTDTYPASNAIDGNTNTFWQSANPQQVGEAIIGDLGVERFITKVSITKPSAFAIPSIVDIYASVDNSTWVSIGSNVALTQSVGTQEIDTENQAGRYIMIEVDTYGNAQTMKISDISAETSTVVQGETFESAEQSVTNIKSTVWTVLTIAPFALFFTIIYMFVIPKFTGSGNTY